MSTSKIIMVVALTAFVAVGGYFMMQSSQKASLVNTENGQEVETETMEAKSLSGTTSLRDLLLRANSTKCTYEYTPETGGTVSGTVYFDNGNMRGDFDIVQDGTSFTSSTIIEGADRMMYTWMDTGMGMHAIKMEIPEASAEGNATNESVSLDEELQYDCSSWNVDASVFVPPTDITFTEMGTQVPAAGMGAEVKLPTAGGDQCSLCDLIPDAGPKAECRAAFSCAE